MWEQFTLICQLLECLLILHIPFTCFQLLQEHISKLKYPTKEDAKVAFLKSMQKWQTYGSVFFEVKVRELK